MQPTTTIDKTGTLGAENASENLRDIAKSAIMDLSEEECYHVLQLLKGENKHE